MKVVVSGEGPGDIGRSENGAGHCGPDDFVPGPMTHVIDKLIEADVRFQYSVLQVEAVHWIGKAELVAQGKHLPKIPKIQLRGINRPTETLYFFKNARALARYAKALENEEEDVVIAVLFRDSDGTQTSDLSLWADKEQSIRDGFRREGFSRGVAMVPKPKQEAWLLCGCKGQPYQNCTALESESGNDNSPNSLKQQFENAFGTVPTSLAVSNWVTSGGIQLDQISMPSFDAFLNSLNDALTAALAPQ